jgi:hypothetical protein
MKTRTRTLIGGWVLGLGLVAGAGASTEGIAGSPPPPSGVGTTAAPAARPGAAASPLDRRVALLTRELRLDDTQQQKVRTLLEGQRAQILQVWQDESLSSALRIKHTQVITERTEDAIRAVLTDEQRRLYSKARPGGAAPGAAGGTSPELSTWIDAVGRH